MLKKLFAKKSVHRTNEQRDGNLNSGQRMANEERKLKALQPLDNASNNGTYCDKENNPVSTYKTSEMIAVCHANKDLEFTCCQCGTPDSSVKAAGYCTDCKQFVCVPCIERHYTKDHMMDHIMLQLILITKSTNKTNLNGKTDNNIAKETNDKTKDTKEIEDTAEDRREAIDKNSDIPKVKDYNKEFESEANVKEYLKNVKECDKGISNTTNEDKPYRDSTIDKEMEGSNARAQPDNNMDKGVVNNIQEALSDQKLSNEVPRIRDADKQTEHDSTLDTYNKDVTNSHKFSKQGPCPYDSNTEETLLTAHVSGNEASISKETIQVSEKLSVVPEKFSFVKDIKVKYEGDAKNCFISGIAVLSDKRIAVLDNNNKNIKTLHTDWGIDGVIQFSNNVGAMTSLPSEQIAVTIPQEKRIKLLSTINEISVVANIRFLVEYYHIVYCNGKLLVSMHEPLQFRLLGLDGILLQKVIPMPDVAAFITTKECMHLAISQDEKQTFVCNTETNALVAIDMEGALVAFKNTELEKPSGIMMSDSDELYVCNRDKHSVHKMTRDFTEDHVLLKEADGILFPYSVCFYPDKKYLYISSKCDDKNVCNNVKMFKS